jgi:hypothetical protein
LEWNLSVLNGSPKKRLPLEKLLRRESEPCQMQPVVRIWLRKISAGLGSGRNTLDQEVGVENAVVGGSIAVGSGRVIAGYEQHKVASTTVVQRAALG